MQMLRIRAAWLLAAAVWCCGTVQAQDRGTGSDAELLRALRSGGHVILIRHASTVPGIGDPAGFVLTDCATQRNLAAMVDNPADLEQPRPETPAYTPRRNAAFDKYRKGVSTTTIYPEADKAKLSDTGK